MVNVSLNLQDRIGHRLISTMRLGENAPFGKYETIVFGGRKQDKVAHRENYNSASEAIEGHKRTVRDVGEHPETYRLDN